MSSGSLERFTTAFVQFEQRNKDIICYGYALMAAICFTSTNFMVKIVPRLTSSELLLYRSIQLYVLTYFFMESRKMDFYFKRPVINKTLIFRGFVGFTSMALNYYAIKLLPLSEASVIQQTSPIIVGILATLILKEKYEFSQFIGALFCMLGVVLIVQPEFIFGVDETHREQNAQKLIGVLALLAGTTLVAITQILVKQLGSQTNEGIITLIFGAISAIFCPIITFYQGFYSFGLRDLIIILIMGTLSFVGQMCRNKAYILGKPGKVALMAYSGIIYSVFLDVFVLGSDLEFLSILGVISIFSSLFVMLYQIVKKQSK